mmetsp:Transcript_6501/g.11969  ORF Transcript_6501/g.11969 Transcript_6501/m.11969 type:complete len:213 (+) Transcript_6501:125-763(+)
MGTSHNIMLALTAFATAAFFKLHFSNPAELFTAPQEPGELDDVPVFLRGLVAGIYVWVMIPSNSLPISPALPFASVIVGAGLARLGLFGESAIFACGVVATYSYVMYLRRDTVKEVANPRRAAKPTVEKPRRVVNQVVETPVRVKKPVVEESFGDSQSEGEEEEEEIESSPAQPPRTPSSPAPAPVMNARDYAKEQQELRLKKRLAELKSGK